MANRTTAALVRGIIAVDEDDFPDDASLEPFIVTANELVTEACGSSGYSTARLELVERWLSAHFFAIRDPRAASESAGVSISYLNPSLGKGFDGTTYGQQALLLDTAGGLAALSRGKVGVTWLGEEADEEE